MASLLFDGEEAAVAEAYQDVRNDNTETQWVLCVYDEKKVRLHQTGTDYDELLSELQDDQRAYAYIRFEVGDEMSRRAKFVFLTWVGPSVSPLKKAKVSTDKAFVKEIFTEFGIEVLADEKSELERERLEKRLTAASGAAYGTGK